MCIHCSGYFTIKPITILFKSPQWLPNIPRIKSIGFILKMAYKPLGSGSCLVIIRIRIFLTISYVLCFTSIIPFYSHSNI